MSMKEGTRNNRLELQTRKSTFHQKDFLRTGKTTIFQEMQSLSCHFLQCLSSGHPEISLNL